jgi:hypothetical protein
LLFVAVVTTSKKKSDANAALYLPLDSHGAANKRILPFNKSVFDVTALNGLRSLPSMAPRFTVHPEHNPILHRSFHHP